MKKTLGDQLRNFWQNYIAPSAEDVKKGRKEEILVAGDDQIPQKKNDPFTKKLSATKCVAVAEQCPLFMKGARKKARDSIRAWHRIEHIDKTKKPYKADLAYIYNFSKRNNLKSLWERLRVAAFTTGDGYLLITFDNDEKTTLENPPAKGAVPYKVRLLDSTYVTEIGFNPNKPKQKENLIKSFHYEDSKTGEDNWIYPDRILHMTNDLLFGEFGNAKVNLLRNIIKSSVNVDIATGDILAWFAHGYFDIIQNDCGENEIKKWQKVVNQHPGAFIHGDDAEIKAIAPQAIDPKPFYDYLILSIAASFFMPTHILTGIQVGKVTGAEVGTGDYVKDLKDDQELDYSPLLERLYKMLLTANGRTWDSYEIIWNPIYIDELSEANILESRVRAADMAFNGSRGAGGFTDQEESRRIFNSGQIMLNPTKKIKVKAPMNSTPETPKPANDTEDEEMAKISAPNKKAKEAMEKYGITPNPHTFQLDSATRVMIEKRKAQIAKEKKLGEDILKEQDNANNDKD